MSNKKEEDDILKTFHSVLKGMANSNATIMEFVEDILRPGWNLPLFLSQRVILKSVYNLDLTPEEEALRERWIKEDKCNWKPRSTEYSEVILQCGQRGSKCCGPETPVYTHEHGFTSIGKLIPKPIKDETIHSDIHFSIMTPNGLKPISGALSQKKKQAFKLTTRRGFQITGSDKHRVRVMGHSGTLEWKLVKDLTNTDYVAVDRSIRRFSSSNDSVWFKGKELNERNLCRLLGLLVGDGYCNQPSTTSFTSADKDLGQEFIDLVKDLFDHEVRVRKDPKSKASAYFISSKPIRTFLADLGLTYTTAYFKSVPEYVNKASSESIKAFLQGLFDTDGHVSASKFSVGFCTASEQLAREVHHILTYFGVVATKKHRTSTYVLKSGEKSTSYNFLITGDSYNKFIDNIGFGLARKQGVIQDRYAPISNGSTTDKVPHLAAYLRAAKDKQGFSTDRLTWNRIRHQCYGNTTRKTDIPGGLTYPKVLEAAEFFSKTESTRDTAEALFKLYSDNYFFDQVVSVEESISDLYDIWVPDGNEYLAGGMIHHNTTLSAIIMAYEFYRLCCNPDPQNYLGIPSSAPIFLTVMATTAEQGNNTIFGWVRNLIMGSSYFESLIKQNKIRITTGDIEYDEKRIKISLGHSNATAILGRSAIGVAFDELAFFSVDQGASSNAPEIYARIGRSSATFGSKAKRVTSSSVREKGDFLESLVRDSWDNAEQGTLVFNLTSFDMNPTLNKYTNPIISLDYKRDVEQAQRDYENIRPGIASGFLSQQVINSAMFLDPDQWVLAEADQLTDIVRGEERTYVRKNLLKLGEPPREHEYFCHCDPAVINDSFALVVGHPEYTSSGIKTVIDVILEWIPNKHANSGKYEVDLENVYTTLVKLNKIFNFKQITFDQWESHGFIQRLFREGIPTFKHPFGRSNQLQMYRSLKTRMVDGLLVMPRNESLREELENLIVKNGSRIDHPTNKASSIEGKKKISKDISDCIAVINWYIAEQEINYDNNPELRPTTGLVNVRTIGRSGAAQLNSRFGYSESRMVDNI